MAKYHFVTEAGNACGRTGRIITDRVNQVTCLNCKGTPVWQEAYRAMKAQQEVAFAAQTPRQVPSVWDHRNNITCRECGGDLFRERPRSLFSYNYVCEACGTTCMQPTETGMCT